MFVAFLILLLVIPIMIYGNGHRPLYQVESLQNIDSICIIIDADTANLGMLGISERLMRAKIGYKLSSVGIEVIHSEYSYLEDLDNFNDSTCGVPVLYLMIDIIPGNYGEQHIYSIDFDIFQKATRCSGFFMRPVETWTYGILGTANDSADLMNSIMNITYEFLDEYLYINQVDRIHKEQEPKDSFRNPILDIKYDN